MWMNVDRPTKKITLHEDQCKYIPTSDSKYKKLGGILGDGGWISFESREKALLWYEDTYPTFDRGHCYYCSTTPPSKNEDTFKSQLTQEELEDITQESWEDSVHSNYAESEEDEDK